MSNQTVNIRWQRHPPVLVAAVAIIILLSGRSGPSHAQPNQPEAVDARIEIVWPHDREGNQRPVGQAELVNIGMDLFKHPVPFYDFPSESPPRVAVGLGFAKPVSLLRSLDNGYLEQVKPADEVITVTHGNLSWPRWVFNDVDASAATDPLRKYYFSVAVQGVATHTTVWSHGADARTYLPQRDVPTSGSPGVP